MWTFEWHTSQGSFVLVSSGEHERQRDRSWKSWMEDEALHLNCREWTTSECACEIVFGEPSNYHTYCANRNWQDAWDVKEEHWHVIFANRLFIQPANNGGADALLCCSSSCVCTHYSVSLCPWTNIHSIHIPGHFQPHTQVETGWSSRARDPNRKLQQPAFFTCSCIRSNLCIGGRRNLLFDAVIINWQ